MTVEGRMRSIDRITRKHFGVLTSSEKKAYVDQFDRVYALVLKDIIGGKKIGDIRRGLLARDQKLGDVYFNFDYDVIMAQKELTRYAYQSLKSVGGVM